MESPVGGVPLGGNVDFLENGIHTANFVSGTSLSPVEIGTERGEVSHLDIGRSILALAGIFLTCIVNMEAGNEALGFLAGLAADMCLLIDGELVPRFGGVVNTTNLQRVDEGIDLLLVTTLQTTIGTGIDDGVHPAGVGIGNGA